MYVQYRHQRQHQARLRAKLSTAPARSSQSPRPEIDGDLAAATFTSHDSVWDVEPDPGLAFGDQLAQLSHAQWMREQSNQFTQSKAKSTPSLGKISQPFSTSQGWVGSTHTLIPLSMSSKVHIETTSSMDLVATNFNGGSSTW
jgi:hypothetical protein